MNPNPLNDYEQHTQEQLDMDALNRRKMLHRVLTSAKRQPHPAADLVLMVDALGLDEELAELASRSERHQQALTDVRAELEQLAGRSSQAGE